MNKKDNEKGNKKEVNVLREYMDRIENAPEQRIIREIDSIKWSFKIFGGNYSELIKPLKILENSPKAIKLWDVKKRKDRRERGRWCRKCITFKCGFFSLAFVRRNQPPVHR